jgi:hypothetical protein
MGESELFDAIAKLGGLVVLAGALLTGLVMTKAAHDGVMRERDRADAVRDQRLEDQKVLNKEMVGIVKETADALKRLADAWEARNRAEADRGKPSV